MKKSLLVVLGLMVMSLLVACGTKDGNNELDSNLVDGTIVNEENNVDPLADLVNKTPLTLEDLDRIDEYRFPVSYEYTEYDTNGSVKTGEYVYPKGADHKLLPIYEDMASREIVSSVMSHDRINTTLNIFLNNGDSYSVLYINNPETLEYIGASLTTPTSTVSYSFEY